MITTVIHPAIIQWSVLFSSIHVSYPAPEGTAISFAAACLTRVIAARARGAREMYSVSIVSFRAELGPLKSNKGPREDVGRLKVADGSGRFVVEYCEPEQRNC